MTKLTIPEVEEAIGIPSERWKDNCHAISLAIVKSELIEGPRRVARGTCTSVGGQHSWVVVGNDCYDLKAQLIDPTLWCYVEKVKGIWHGRPTSQYRHTPHGGGQRSIWDVGRPPPPVNAPVLLAHPEGLSEDARLFLKLIGPLDRQGWSILCGHLPVIGWPAAEIVEAMCDTPELEVLVPIDREGMLTNRNPGGVYLPDGGDCGR
jgi:hypothetical protein